LLAAVVVPAMVQAKKPEEAARRPRTIGSAGLRSVRSAAVVESRLRRRARDHSIIFAAFAGGGGGVVRAGFAHWKDVARLGVLGVIEGAMIVAWMIAVHGEMPVQLRPPAGRVPGDLRRRIRAPKSEEINGKGRPPSIGHRRFFDADIPGRFHGCATQWSGAAVWLRHGYTSLPAQVSGGRCRPRALCGGRIGGAIGYTRIGMKRVKALLASERGAGDD